MCRRAGPPEVFTGPKVGRVYLTCQGCRDAQNAYNREHAEERRAYTRAYVSRNRGAVLQRRRQSYAANRETIAAAGRALTRFSSASFVSLRKGLQEP